MTTGVPTVTPRRAAALSPTMASSSRPLEPTRATSVPGGCCGVAAEDAPGLVDVADDAHPAVGGPAGKQLGRDVGDQVAEGIDLDDVALDPPLRQLRLGPLQHDQPLQRRAKLLRLEAQAQRGRPPAP